MQKLAILCIGLILYTSTTYAFEAKVYKSDDTFKLKEQLGKTVVINFWASWCTACIEELPLLRDLKTKYEKKGVQFVAVNAGEKNKKIKKFLKRYEFPYKVLLDPKKEIAKSYGIDHLPVTIVIDKNGQKTYQNEVPPTDLKL